RACERIADAAGPYLVAIRLRARAETGVEIGRRVGDLEHADVFRQLGVEGTNERVDRVREADGSAGHLAERVHPGIGPARAVRRDGTAFELRERVFEQPLYRLARRLALPADEPRAVVREGDLQGARHASGSPQRSLGDTHEDHEVLNVLQLSSSASCLRAKRAILVIRGSRAWSPAFPRHRAGTPPLRRSAARW